MRKMYMEKIDRKELKKASIKQLGEAYFGETWIMALAIFLIANCIFTVMNKSYGILTLIFGGLISLGLAYVSLKRIRDGKPLDFGNLFYAFKDDFGKNLLVGLISKLYIMLWSLLLIIPGIVKMYSYALVYYIRLDHPDLNTNEIVTLSRKMMDGRKAELFCLDLSFIGWYILSALTLGILALWVVPYHHFCRTNFYERVRLEYEQ